MVFRRKIDDELLKWKNEVNGEKDLLIEGARRIGKSRATLKFAKENYKSYILIDFGEAREAIKQLFYNLLDKNVKNDINISFKNTKLCF